MQHKLILSEGIFLLFQVKKKKKRQINQDVQAAAWQEESNMLAIPREKGLKWQNLPQTQNAHQKIFSNDHDSI